MDHDKPEVAGAEQPEDRPPAADLHVEEAQAEDVKGGTQTRQTSVVVDM